MEGLGFELREEASLAVLTSDVVKSSAIEGEVLDPQEVRSSIARRLGLDIAGVSKVQRNVEGVVEMMLDATQDCEEKLTKKRLFAWHASAVSNRLQQYATHCRGNMASSRSRGRCRVVSGAYGREKVHFEAPEASRIESK